MIDHGCKALQYIHPSIHPVHYVLFLQAHALVEEETRRYRPTKNYLDYLPPADYNAYEVWQQAVQVIVDKTDQ